MARPKHEQPTPAELEVLKILWETGPVTVRDVMTELANRKHNRAYTSIMSLMNVMADKRLLKRKRKGRAFVYSANTPRESTLGRMVTDLWRRAFDGSTTALVTQLLDEANPTDEELAEIRRALETYEDHQETKK